MDLDRRRFLTGGWPAAQRVDRAVPPDTACAIVVQAHPARLDQAIAAVEALGPVELVARDARGRLTFALPAGSMADNMADNMANLALTLTAISQLPGVLSATLATPARDGVHA